jgi:UDP-N-acetylglucosamine--N-acetylmuramyl-(pentapeptide) pyrophosphoryl-undecaprenol N-acetylglucosamine transferase
VSKRILITSGGTGGHVFPALCVAKELKKRGYDIVFSTDTRGFRYIENFKDSIIIQKIHTDSRAKLCISLLINTSKSLFRIFKIKPELVIGFGGYPSVPFLLSAQLLGIKTFVHEQNAIIGKANKFLSKMATKIITSFPETKKLSQNEKNIYIGNPTRYEELYNPVTTLHNNDIFIILIFGGSQGAKIFSKEVVEAICDFSKFTKIEVFHQGRVEDISRIKAKYDSHNVKNIVESFFKNIGKLYQKANLIISRAGASSIFEIIGFQKPSILIPYGKSINGDQIENANFLTKKNAAIAIEEDYLTKDKLTKTLIELVKNKNKIETMRGNLCQIQTKDITKKFAEVVEKELYNHDL